MLIPAFSLLAYFVLFSLISFSFLAQIWIWIYTELLSWLPQLAKCHNLSIISSFFLSGTGSFWVLRCFFNCLAPIFLGDSFKKKKLFSCLYNKHLLAGFSIHLLSCSSFSVRLSLEPSWVTGCHFQLQACEALQTCNQYNILLLMDTYCRQTGSPSQRLQLTELHLDC